MTDIIKVTEMFAKKMKMKEISCECGICISHTVSGDRIDTKDCVQRRYGSNSMNIHMIMRTDSLDRPSIAEIELFMSTIYLGKFVVQEMLGHEKAYYIIIADYGGDFLSFFRLMEKCYLKVRDIK